MIEVRNVTREYTLGKVKVPALRGVDLTLEKGEFVGLAGPSGSGKSTLLHLIGCLDVPTSGQVLIDGVDTGSLSAAERTTLRREKLGFIFQSFSLVPVLTAAENVEIPLLLGPMRAPERRRRVAEILERTGMGERTGHRPSELSGGQRQRVAIARALVAGPRYVLADEPTANLDSETGARILDLMLELERELGTMFLVATHDPAVVARTERMVLLRDGRIAETAAPLRT